MKVVTIAGSLLVLSAYGSSLKFEELESLVASKNLHVRASLEAVEATERREGYFYRSLLPRLTAEAGYESFQRELFESANQPYGSIQAEVNIFNGWKDRLEEKTRQEESRVSQAEKLQARREELLKAQTEYWEIAFLKDQLNLLESYEKRNIKNLESARRRISAGSATQSDQMEFEMTMRLIEQDVAKTKTRLANSLQKLNVLIGNDPSDSLSVADELPKGAEFDFEKLTMDSDSLPEVTVAQAAARVATFRRKQHLRWWAPRLDAYSGFKQLNMRESDEFQFADRREYVVGLKLSVLLFDGGDSIAEARSQAALARSLENKATQSSRELSVEFENSKAELRQLSQQVNAASKDAEMADRFLIRILSEYSRGVKSGSEVLSASDRSYEFQRRFAELRKDFQVSKVKLLSLISQRKR